MRLPASLSSLLVLGVAAWSASDTARPARGSLHLGDGPGLAKPPAVAQELSDAFAEVVEQVQPAVVTVYTTKTVQVQAQGNMLPFLFGFPQEPGEPQGGQQRKEMGGGSGFVVDSRGYVLTTAHVVKDQDEIKVELQDRTRFDAKVVGIDEKADVAVIRIDPGKTKLAVASFGNSDELRIGQWVLALGNPYMFRNTVTAGIVSAKGRNELEGDGYADYIQTDAAVNPGNSGGPLVNVKGQVVGINSSIWSRSGGYQGISFAIPINMAKRIAEDLICEGVVTRGWLGLVIEDVDPELADALKIPGRNGAKVVQVAGGSPSAAAGAKAGDIVLQLSGKPVTGSADLRNRVASERPGTKVVLHVLRDGKELDLNVSLGKLGSAVEDSVTASLESPDGTFLARRFGLKLAELGDKERSDNGLPANLKGVFVTGVAPGSPAQEKGIKEGSAILEVIDPERRITQATSAAQVARLLGQIPSGSTVALKVAFRDQVKLVGLRARDEKK
jgi:serine protease Do